MSDTGLSGKMSVLAALLALMEEQGDKVKNVSFRFGFCEIYLLGCTCRFKSNDPCRRSRRMYLNPDVVPPLC